MNFNISKHNRKKVAKEPSWMATLLASNKLSYNVLIYIFFQFFFLFAHTMLDGYHHIEEIPEQDTAKSSS